MTAQTLTGARAAHSGPRISLFSLLSLWRSRQRLAALDAARLTDIGLDASDALTESQKPLWNVPQHWLR